jgi:hypothetical protein
MSRVAAGLVLLACVSNAFGWGARIGDTSRLSSSAALI